ncbi:MAG: hypothetical protein HQL39_16745 [Alphaproteobacteria bacterium]|nr:hypothetical protein [Alphaproteobacteria bacterium]
MRGIGAVLAAGIAVSGLAGCGGLSLQGDEGIIYLAVGASETGGLSGFAPSQGYAYRIAEAIDQQKHVSLIPLAIPGARAKDLAPAVEATLDTAPSPHLVTVWVGANDLAAGRDIDDFADDLDALVASIRDETRAPLVMATLPDLAALPRFRDRPDPDVTADRVLAYNAVILLTAQRHGARLVDLHRAVPTAELVAQDGAHHGGAGHARIASEFLKVIRPALGLSEPPVEQLAQLPEITVGNPVDRWVETGVVESGEADTILAETPAESEFPVPGWLRGVFEGVKTSGESPAPMSRD